MRSIYKKPEVTQALADFYRVCPVCQEPFQRVGRVPTYHHTLHNTHGNRAKFPHYIDSHANGKPVHWHCIGRDNRFVTHELSASRYEAFYKAFADYVRNHEPMEYVLFERLRDVWSNVKTGSFITADVTGPLAPVLMAFVELVKHDAPKDALVFADLRAIWAWLSK